MRTVFSTIKLNTNQNSSDIESFDLAGPVLDLADRLAWACQLRLSRRILCLRRLLLTCDALFTKIS